MGDFRETMLASIARQSVRRTQPTLARGMCNGIKERGDANEGAYFAKREAVMMRKLKKHSPDAANPIGPDYFVRRSTFKVASLDVAAEIDEILINDAIPLAKAQDGYLGCERIVCGKHLDYAVMTKWDSGPNLVASGPGSPYMEMVLQKLDGLVDKDSITSQNFMGDTARFD